MTESTRSDDPRPDGPVDVVIVNYHSGAVLQRCVDALREYLPAEAHYIFVDNSPGDGAVEPVAAALEVVSVLPQPTNVGFAAAVNAGIAAGRAPLVLLVNPDVVAVGGDFAFARDRFAARPSLGALTGRVVDEDGVLMHCRRRPEFSDLVVYAVGAHRVPRRFRRRPLSLVEWTHDEPRDVENVIGAFLFLRRGALQDVGPFDERFFFYWEETDWLLRASRLGWATEFVPDIEIVHLGRASSPPSAAHSELFAESAHRFARKWFGRRRAAALALLWLAADLAHLAARRRADGPAARRRVEVHLRELVRGVGRDVTDPPAPVSRS